jgi:hypothetical protein
MKRKQTSKSGARTSIPAYDAAQPAAEASVCRRLRAEIGRALPHATSRVWHGAPVWFVRETPVVGYSVPARGGVALLFWNGRSFADPALEPVGKFAAAQIRFGGVAEIQVPALRRWLQRAGKDIWDVRAIRRRIVRARKHQGARRAPPARPRPTRRGRQAGSRG